MQVLEATTALEALCRALQLRSRLTVAASGSVSFCHCCIDDPEYHGSSWRQPVARSVAAIRHKMLLLILIVAATPACAAALSSIIFHLYARI